MIDRTAFMRAIIANPDEDAPRLIYADWLEEQGDTDRAEFIRAQCELERLPPSDERRSELARRPWDLLFQHNEAWRQELLPQYKHIQLRHVRGLPEAMIGEAGEVLEALAHVQGRAPIREVMLYETKGYGDAWAACPYLPTIQRMKVVETERRDADFRTIIQSPKLSRLATLTCSGGFVQVGTLEVLSQQPHLSTLRELVVSENGFGNPGLSCLANSQYLHGLVRLDVRHCDISNDGFKEMCALKAFPNLESLDLSQNWMLRNIAKPLAKVTHWTKLRELRLNRTGISSNGAKPIAKTEFFQRLNCLELRNNSISDEVATALRESLGDRVLLGDDWAKE